MVVECTFKHAILVKRVQEFVEEERRRKAAGDVAAISKSSLALLMCQGDKNTTVSNCGTGECQEAEVSSK